MLGVVHCYDVNGGFGDAIPIKELILVTLSRKEAEDFVKSYAAPHIYEEPYAPLKCGELVVEELPTSTDKVDMWWLK